MADGYRQLFALVEQLRAYMSYLSGIMIAG
jgi:hypothetical protein